MSEQFPLSPEHRPTEKLKALDEKWFTALQSATKIESLKCMDGMKATRDEEQEKFMRGEVENPSLDYRIVTEEQKLVISEEKKNLYKSPEDLQRMETTLLALKEQIREEEKNDAIKRAYVWKINEKIAELRMLKEIAPRETVTKGGRLVAPKTAEQRSRRFSRYSEYIYGKPSPEVFAYTIQEMKAAAEALLSGEDSPQKQAATDLLASLPDISSIPYDAETFGLPKADLVADISTKMQKEMGPLISHVPQKPKGEKLVASEIRTAMNAALETMNAAGWTVVEDENRKKMIVSHTSKTVTVPATRTGTPLEIMKLIGHELGIHVGRAQEAATQSKTTDGEVFMLFSSGLDRYAKAEEGVATMAEQGIAGEVKEFPRLEYHLAVSLAKGLDGKPRDFRGVYEILEKWAYFKKLRAGAPENKAKQEAATEAYDFCVGTFRGTDAKTPGACFSKDIVYREGNIKVWRFLGKNPDDLVKVRMGKWDQSAENQRHEKVLHELGIVKHMSVPSELARPDALFIQTQRGISDAVLDDLEQQP